MTEYKYKQGVKLVLTLRSSLYLNMLVPFNFHTRVFIQNETIWRRRITEIKKCRLKAKGSLKFEERSRFVSQLLKELWHNVFTHTHNTITWYQRTAWWADSWGGRERRRNGNREVVIASFTRTRAELELEELFGAWLTEPCCRCTPPGSRGTENDRWRSVTGTWTMSGVFTLFKMF